ncbi:hypothetical protein B0H14DRAFT_2581953 [Mycena olivaceomarginata]|nr:hypothetical protein B0H14DRAFT_2581953 [Mycena olivaceomarginata]
MSGWIGNAIDEDTYCVGARRQPQQMQRINLQLDAWQWNQALTSNSKFKPTLIGHRTAPEMPEVGRKAAVDVRVDGIKDCVAHTAGLIFGLGTFFIRPYGVITRLHCFNVLGPPPHAPNLVPSNMLGELEIFVLPNVSHKYFPGEKTIVRFRLFGFTAHWNYGLQYLCRRSADVLQSGRQSVCS